MRYAGEQEGRGRRGEHTADGRSPTWGAWRDQWLAGRRVEPQTARQDATRIRRYLTPRWEAVRLNRITRPDVQAWVNELADTQAHRRDGDPRPDATISPATVDRIYRLFSTSMKAAVLDGKLAATPCVGIKLPTVAPGHERYLTRGEFDLIAFHLREPHASMAVLLVGTGMRFGEAAGLHWQRVDLEHGEIHIVETWDPEANEIKPYPKGHLVRAVPIPSWLRAVLEAQIDRQGKPRTSCGLPHRHGARCRSGLVVPAPEGGAFDGHNFGQREWTTAVGLAGVGHCRLHDLRHSYASWLRQAGVDLEEVQRLLGHASITTTQKYSHLGSSQRGGVLAALDQRAPGQSL
jgi:integrase